MGKRDCQQTRQISYRFSKKRKSERARRGERRCEGEERKKIHRQFSIPILITGRVSVASHRNGDERGEIREEVHVFVTYDFYDPSRSNVPLTFHVPFSLFLSLSVFLRTRRNIKSSERIMRRVGSKTCRFTSSRVNSIPDR